LLTSNAQVTACGEGGLSGAPLQPRSNQVVGADLSPDAWRAANHRRGRRIHRQDAWEKICAGASLIQLYTGFIYEGPNVARRINEGLLEILKREGFHSLDDAVGCNVK